MLSTVLSSFSYTFLIYHDFSLFLTLFHSLFLSLYSLFSLFPPSIPSYYLPFPLISSYNSFIFLLLSSQSFFLLSLLLHIFTIHFFLIIFYTFLQQGPESGKPEVVCQGNISAITSGGGFSNYYNTPSFQLSAVSNYFVTAKAAGNTPAPGFYLGGRGYPDISLAGFNYLTRIGGFYYLVSGTSASTPSFAGFISNVNSERLKVNKSSIGWLNPSLYSYHDLFTNDVTSGNNLCVATGVCCPSGFYATKGWDPTTGLGSINYQKFHLKLSSLGKTQNLTNYPTMSPTSYPTGNPIVKGFNISLNTSKSSYLESHHNCLCYCRS